MNDAPPRRRLIPAVLRRNPEPEAWQTAAEKRAAEAAAKAEAGDQSPDKAKATGKAKSKPKVKVKLPPLRIAPDGDFERLVLVIFAGALVIAIVGALAARFPILHDVADWWDSWATWWASHTGAAKQ